MALNKFVAETETPEEALDEMRDTDPEEMLEILIGSYLLYVKDATDQQVHALALALGLSKEKVEGIIYKMTSELLEDATPEFSSFNPKDEEVADLLDSDGEIVLESSDDDDDWDFQGAESTGSSIEISSDDDLNDPEMASTFDPSTDDDITFDGMPDPAVQKDQEELIENPK